MFYLKADAHEPPKNNKCTFLFKENYFIHSCLYELTQYDLSTKNVLNVHHYTCIIYELVFIL